MHGPEAGGAGALGGRNEEKKTGCVNKNRRSRAIRVPEGDAKYVYMND